MPVASFKVMKRLKIALVSAEVAPFAKTGGLADVVASLARTLHRQGHEVRLFMPLYGGLWSVGYDMTPIAETQDIHVDYPGATLRCGVFTSPLPNSERDDGTPLDVEFIDCPPLFHRDGYYTSDPDEPMRWATLSRAVLDVMARTDWTPDVVHCNDWHTGLLPLYIHAVYAGVERFANTRTLLSIHNLGYQGVFGADAVDQLGLSEFRGLFHQEHLADGHMSFLETGILYASWLSTVSETYAREIQGEENGVGLDRLLVARSDRLVGIVNGVDVEEWSPASDALIAHNYDAEDLAGKARSTESLLERFGLDPGAESASGQRPMVLGIVSRLTAQKGFELMPDILPGYLERNEVRLVVLGSGESHYEEYFQWLRDTYPDRVGVYLGYNEQLAHWIEAGADTFLMPSLFEPCGLNQMYSLRYGTVPLVRRTGGLADTVEPWDATDQTGTGFVFYDFTAGGLAGTIDQALDVWGDRKSWQTLMRNGMAKDFSWERQSAHYVDLYRTMMES